jgi:pimeloyl-ACP methyl ester carboxylesterase
MPFAKLGDVDLHYLCVERGGASPCDDMVMVHGLGANLGFWYLRMLPAFSDEYRITIYDLRGHGLSSMPAQGYGIADMGNDLGRLLDFLGIESAHLVAHSFGGSVALRFACEHPERVKTLTLADVRIRSLQPEIELEQWGYWPRYRDALQSIGIDFQEHGGEFGVQLFERLARLRLKQPDLVFKLGETIPSPFAGKSGKRSALRWLRMLEATSAAVDFMQRSDIPVEMLRTLDIPILAVYGEHSQALPTADALRRLWPHADVRVAPHAGHFFPATSPEKLIQPMREFLGISKRSVSRAV